MAMKKMKMGKGMDMNCENGTCGHANCHPHYKGKALLNIALGLLLMMFGFHFIPTIELLAQLLGVIFALKGAIKLMSC